MKKFLATVLCCILVLASGCAPTQEACEHDFTNYVIVEPSCVKEGMIERVCTICGEKVYEPLQPLGHTWKDGVCVVCGEVQDPDGTEEPGEGEEPGGTDDPGETEEPLPDRTLFMSFKDVYEKSQLLGFAYTAEEFYQFAENVVFTDLYLNGSNRLKVTADGVVSDVGEVCVDAPFSAEAELGVLMRAEIKNGQLFVSDRTGSTKSFGVFTVYAEPQNQDTIDGFLLNFQSELLLLYSGGEIVKVGTVAENDVEHDESLLLYTETESGYKVYGPFDRTLERITIAPTHLGKQVESIDWYAFERCKSLKFVDVSEGIQKIDLGAFYGCTSLTSVVLPVSLTRIGQYAFHSCPLEAVYFRGTQEQWLQISGSQTIPVSAVYFYSEEMPSASSGNFWHYVDGQPAIWRIQWV